MTAPLRVWRMPLAEQGHWLSPEAWRWKCRLCVTSPNEWYGNSAPNHPAAIKAAVGHLDVYHQQPAQPRRMGT